MPFHDSPVLIRKSMRSDLGKFSKFACFVMYFPCFKFPKRFIPRIANIKKNKNKTLATFNKAGNVDMSVCSNALNPLVLGNNLTISANRKIDTQHMIDIKFSSLKNKPIREQIKMIKAKIFHLSYKK